MNRGVIVVAILLALAGLLLWQHLRERQMAQCADAGGIWNGRKSECVPRPGMILHRDLQRS